MKITKKTIANLTPGKLKELLMQTEYKRKLGWNAYFAIRDMDLLEALEERDVLVSVIEEQETLMETIDCDVVNGKYIINQIKDLMDKYKHKYECSICLADMDSKSIGVLGCGHKYHKVCILKWKETKDTCPHCRTKFYRVI